MSTCLISGTCPAGTPISYKVNDTTTQDFYVLKDNGTTLDLITDKVVATNVQWNSSGDNSGGPVTATEALENATSSWTNVSSNTYNGATGQATRARLITKEETENMGCREYKGDSDKNSCPVWLSDHSILHWTSTPLPDNHAGAWNISTSSSCALAYNHVGDGSEVGIRAVVTVSK